MFYRWDFFADGQAINQREGSLSISRLPPDAAE
jgi:hypothetical protein